MKFFSNLHIFSKGIASLCFLINSAPLKEPLGCLLALERLQPYLSLQNFIILFAKPYLLLDTGSEISLFRTQVWTQSKPP